MVEIGREQLFRFHDLLSQVADRDGDARALLGEVTEGLDWLRDVLLGR